MTRDELRVGAPPADPIAELLQGMWVDPDSGKRTRVPIDAIAIEPTLRGTEGDRVEALALGRRFAVVSDVNTHRILGERVEKSLRARAKVDSIVLEGDASPDGATTQRVRDASRTADALIAVGSGTINDLAKYAAALDRKPYAVFATAPSMNGYTSANAAITVDGHKKTLPATLARGVFVDLEILSRAPLRMIRAGLGDSLCRPTAQIDWLMSHRVLGTPYKAAPFRLLEADEPVLFGAPEALVSGDARAMRALARTLILSGIGMTICGGSYPASQGEHLISHYIDMLSPPSRDAHLHGEQVAVATLTMARLQETMLATGPPLLRASPVGVGELQRHFGDDPGWACWDEFRHKRLDAERAAALTERTAAVWAALQKEAASIAIPSSVLRDVMLRAGGPSTPADIGLDRAFYADAVSHARFLRNRYTFLDLAADSGVPLS